MITIMVLDAKIFSLNAKINQTNKQLAKLSGEENLNRQSIYSFSTIVLIYDFPVTISKCHWVDVMDGLILFFIFT